MKKLFAIVLFFIVVFAGCQSKQQETVQKVEPSFMSISHVAIKTFQDYYEVESAAQDNYEKITAKAWADYTVASAAARNIYSTFKKAELMKFCNADQKACLEWLDAEETGDYDYAWRKDIEGYSSAAEVYSFQISARNLEYERAVEGAYNNYKSADVAAYTVYKDRTLWAYIAYMAYRGNP
ncbi:MAG: hypothetical protein WCX97_03520 [Candidatus Magasanikbacteria bacterium]